MCVLFLLAIGRLEGEDGKYPDRLPSSRTLFGERYGQQIDLEIGRVRREL